MGDVLMALDFVRVAGNAMRITPLTDANKLVSMLASTPLAAPLSAVRLPGDASTTAAGATIGATAAVADGVATDGVAADAVAADAVAADAVGADAVGAEAVSADAVGGNSIEGSPSAVRISARAAAKRVEKEKQRDIEMEKERQRQMEVKQAKERATAQDGGVGGDEDDEEDEEDEEDEDEDEASKSAPVDDGPLFAMHLALLRTILADEARRQPELDPRALCPMPPRTHDELAQRLRASVAMLLPSARASPPLCCRSQPLQMHTAPPQR